MNFTNAEGKANYLNYEDLVIGEQVYRTTYVVDVKSSVTHYMEPYYILFVKTTEGPILPCFVFNVDDFNELGFKLNLLKGKYIKLNAKAVETEGKKISLRFIGLELIRTPNEQMVQAFTKKIEGIENYYKELNDFFKSSINKEIPEYLCLLSFPQIYNGYTGGYVKFCWDVLMHIMTVTSGTTDTDLLEILYNVFIHYNFYLNHLNKINIITDSEKIDLINKIPNSTTVDILSRNTLSSLMGLGKVNHYISVLIDSTFKYVNLNIEVKESWNTLRPGGECKCGDYTLLRY